MPRARRPRRARALRAAAPASRRPQPIESYFRDGYYGLYRHILLPEEQTAAEAAGLLRMLAPAPGARWLDVPCGFGRHLLALRPLRPDLRLAGGDLNDAYLREPGLAAAAAVARCDMRRLPYARGAFDAVLNMLNSFGYYPGEDRAVLHEWARVLRPGGWLVLDLPSRQALLRLVRVQPTIRYAAGEREAIESFEWDARSQCLTNQTRWRWPGGREKAGYCVRLYTPAQMRAMLAREGFEVVGCYGDFCGGRFDPHRSDRMLLLARRRKAAGNHL